MRSIARIAEDVDRGAELFRQQAALKREMDEITARLKADALDRPDEHIELADAKLEGRQWIAKGDALELPVIIGSDKIVASFAPKSKTEERILVAAGSDAVLNRFFRLSAIRKNTQKNGKAFRAFAAEVLGPKAPGLVTASKLLDKHGIPKYDVKMLWAKALGDEAIEGEEEGE